MELCQLLLTQAHGAVVRAGWRRVTMRRKAPVLWLVPAQAEASQYLRWDAKVNGSMNSKQERGSSSVFNQQSERCRA